MIEKVIVMGAAGRDFHNFNIYFRNNPRYNVLAFTAAQIPDIDSRVYPPELSGELYPKGIPIYPESSLAELIKTHQIDLVAMSYSDLTHLDVMHKASLVMAHGADFILIGATYTMLKAQIPVVAVCAVRTGCGKSQTTRKVCEILQRLGKKVVAIRHPMPYGNLSKQIVQRFSKLQDLKDQNCTIEEQEEFEPLIEKGITVYAGIDYEKILKEAENEADVIVWDGGNNDTPFYQPDLHIVVFDPHRAGHELLYYPGETNMLMAQVAIINKVDTAQPSQIDQVVKNISQNNPKAQIIKARSPFLVNNPQRIENKKVLIVEDGPTLTHGGMSFGAGFCAAKAFKAKKIIDPRPFAIGSIKQAYHKYPHIGPCLPALGYSKEQINELETTINQADCDLVLFATPIQLTRVLYLNKPAIRVRYDYQNHDEPTLGQVIKARLKDLFPK